MLLVHRLPEATPSARSASGPDRGLDDFKSAKTDKTSAALLSSPVKAAKIRLTLGKGSGASLSQ